MRTLQRVTKYAATPITYPIDANPWLQEVGSTFGNAVVGDSPDLIESSTVRNGVLTLRLVGGIEGTKYRVPVTFFATSGATRAVIVEVSIAGVRPTTAPVSAIAGDGNLDGGGPSSNYGGLPIVDGGQI